MFNDRFIKSLPEDPVLAARAICDAFFDPDADIRSCSGSEAGKYDWYIESLGALCAVTETYDSCFPLPPPFTGDKRQNIQIIRNYFQNAKARVYSESTDTLLHIAKDHFLSKLKATFAYEFSDGDLKRVQTVLNELRELVTASEDFDADHKQRILRKLESLQSELHKRVSSLDKFWGLIGEAGVALGKFGKDAKPFVDGIKEITQIVWRTQARAEELPSGTPLPLLTDASRRENVIHEE